MGLFFLSFFLTYLSSLIRAKVLAVLLRLLCILLLQSVLSFPFPLICLIAAHPGNLSFDSTCSKKSFRITCVGFGLTVPHDEICYIMRCILLYLYVSCISLKAP